ncbi:MAG TPA: organomercurial lyase [Gemmatimonadales bacterium]|nr:organomercurial lyase [Gemmatimonadales bacterium]
MDFATTVKLAIYRLTAEDGIPPVQQQVAEWVGAPLAQVREAYQQLAASRLLVLNPDGATIRMAPPFSGVPTQHRVTVQGIRYYANCAWDAFGIPAALHLAGVVESECAQSKVPLRLELGASGPAPSMWLFHCLVPAAKWWADIVFT